VAGVDGGPDGLRAANYAASVAASRGQGVRLVHAHHVPQRLNAVLPYYGMEEFREAGDIVLRDAEGHVRRATPDLDVEVELIASEPARSLVRASKEASLVVVGRSSRHGVDRALGGSVSTAVAARANAPVASVPGTWTAGRHDSRIVLGVDGSKRASAAARYAFAEASRDGSSLMVVNVWETPARWEVALPPSIESLDPDWLIHAQQELSAHMAGLQADYPDVKVSYVVERGHSPADLLVARAEGSAAIVIGARGTGGVPGLDLGWTARSVLSHSTVPVIVVHRGDVQRG